MTTEENTQQEVSAGNQSPQQTSVNTNQRYNDGSDALILKIVKNVFIVGVTSVVAVYGSFFYFLVSTRRIENYEVSLSPNDIHSTKDMFNLLVSTTHFQVWLALFIATIIISIVLLFLTTNKLSKIILINPIRILVLILAITSLLFTIHSFDSLNSDSKTFNILISDTKYPNVNQISIESRPKLVFQRDLIIQFETPDSIETALAFYKEAIGGNNRITNPEAVVKEREFPEGGGSSFSAQLRVDRLDTFRLGDFRIDFRYQPSSTKYSGTLIIITNQVL